MKIHRSLYIVFVLIGLFFLCPKPGLAVHTPRTYAVLPFKIHGPAEYQHLQPGIQSMLTSRLQWEDHFSPLDKSQINQAFSSLPESKSQAAALRSKLGVDFLIWGSATIIGKQSSLDVHVLGDKDTWSHSTQSPLDNLIPTLEKVAGDINSKIFKRDVPKAESQPSSAKPQGPPNPGLIPTEEADVDEDGQPYSLNPEFRYSGTTQDENRWRSQGLSYVSMGMVVGDANSDDQNEVFILTDRKVLAYIVKGNKLQPLAEYEFSKTFEALSIDILDVDKDGYSEIIVNAIQRDLMRTFMLNLKEGKLVPVQERIDMFLGVVHMPPHFIPTLIGQKKSLGGDIFQTGVHEVIRMGGEFQFGPKVSLPSTANVFNFEYLPQKDGYKLIVVDHKDHLKVYTGTNELQFSSQETFAGSAIGLEKSDTHAGLGKGTTMEGLETYYYLPLRLVTTDLDNNKQHELIVNKNISVAARIFSRFRYFAQGELHSLVWDGIGLNTQWKTRRIKGSVADYGVGDILNNGKLYLYICINTHTGAGNLGYKKTIVLAYPLNVPAN